MFNLFEDQGQRPKGSENCIEERLRQTEDDPSEDFRTGQDVGNRQEPEAPQPTRIEVW